jgi:hypothetical protein
MGYEVTPDLGPWMISTTYYTGPQAREMAYKLVNELRTNYRLPAYVFNYGEEEKKKEQERIQKERERIQELLRRQAEYLQGMEHAPAKMYIRTRRFEDQCIVLVGGYRDQATARRELDRLKKLKAPDPKKVPLAQAFLIQPHSDKVEVTYVNPFAQSFVVHNPTIKQEAAPPSKPDPLLAKLNAREPDSLLKCRKRFTLAVAQFHGATIVVSDVEKGKKGNGGFLDRLGIGGEPGQALNAAALNAHEVATLLKRLNLEAYVLHAQHYSLVTVGGFDHLDEPGVAAVRRQLTQLKPSLEKLPMLREPVPMAIPHP